ncbi:MAG: ORF6N domain-containing protein [Lentimicrobiaceae bacterium]|jgi:hypothetical protein
METTSSILDIKIERAILYIRGQKVMLDIDLADMYGVKTKRLNEQVKRNINRFPLDFMFQLSDDEKQEVVAKCDHLTRLKFSPSNPYAFTEHGGLMLASVLNSPLAIETSVLIVRAFVKLREILLTHAELAKKITELETRYDKQFKIVFQALRALMSSEPEKTERPRIGYKIAQSNE